MREVLVQSGVEPEHLDQARRLPDTLREVGEHALHAVRKWSDPRERELRKRRRLRRRSLRLGAAGGMTAVGAAGLVVISAPVWAVVVVGGGAAALVTGTAVSARRYLDARRNPLPEATFVPRKLPPVRSAARAPIARLVRAEKALHALYTQIARAQRLPADDVADTMATAASGAAALHALAADIVATEEAAGHLNRVTTTAIPGLSEQIRAITARLDAGVTEYEQLVTAAGQILAAPATAVAPDSLSVAVGDLRDAADRLDGWAHALAELADRSGNRGHTKGRRP
ncbi:hypothetical protein EBN03_29365 [Nocardia stercoris]|uniref:Uncharacterized protein n=1 Tax=Nocardia stercoris TaxID=2483361 RepID=A0A3M2KYJ8_9NOCA|nr:hypothetical protein EBN03_29365 [Nocardia stercoris]